MRGTAWAHLPCNARHIPRAAARNQHYPAAARVSGTAHFARVDGGCLVFTALHPPRSNACHPAMHTAHAPSRIGSVPHSCRTGSWMRYMTRHRAPPRAVHSHPRGALRSTPTKLRPHHAHAAPFSLQAAATIHARLRTPPAALQRRRVREGVGGLHMRSETPQRRARVTRRRLTHATGWEPIHERLACDAQPRMQGSPHAAQLHGRVPSRV